ncbi:uncharacterized protein LOC126900259 isoform X2 [Daktulosphaira vitifoliae]|uniref:uncharacterized protein LOC126900259 isoform X2 n=1 Tax=Daktulosphaira vitifoliae TaxID=58002 RepID=UPI0021A9DC2E|nr:uncharacterized protein LOC126900259 isoform X2 [Daktulosphaira vitifoliae]
MGLFGDQVSFSFIYYIYLMLIAVITKNTNSEFMEYNNLLEDVLTSGTIISPSSKSLSLSNLKNVHLYKGGDENTKAETYNNGEKSNEESLKKYNRKKGGLDNGILHQGKYFSRNKKKKGATYKKEHKNKKYKIKKGFRDKHHKDEKHDVNTFWDNYETYETFKKIGKKKNKKINGQKTKKRNEKNKKSKTENGNKKKAKAETQSGINVDTGLNKKKLNSSHYNNKFKYQKDMGNTHKNRNT